MARRSWRPSTRAGSRPWCWWKTTLSGRIYDEERLAWALERLELLLVLDYLPSAVVKRAQRGLAHRPPVRGRRGQALSTRRAGCRWPSRCISGARRLPSSAPTCIRPARFWIYVPGGEPRTPAEIFQELTWVLSGAWRPRDRGPVGLAGPAVSRFAVPGLLGRSPGRGAAAAGGAPGKRFYRASSPAPEPAPGSTGAPAGGLDLRHRGTGELRRPHPRGGSGRRCSSDPPRMPGRLA